MMIDTIHRFIIPATNALLPAAMASDKATAMLLTIGLHEGDGFRARRQYGRGPAHSFWQFERTTVKRVLEHPATEAAMNDLIDALCYRLKKATVARQALDVFNAMQHNDPLACGWARGLLWTVPKPLPGPDDVDESFAQYLAGWNPGAYKGGTDEEKRVIRTRWNHCYGEAWARVRTSPQSPASLQSPHS